MTLAVERVESRPLLGLCELPRLPDARLSDGWVESLLAMLADEGLWFDNHYASLQWKNRDHNTKEKRAAAVSLRGGIRCSW
jgi:hypothetical protein